MAPLFKSITSLLALAASFAVAVPSQERRRISIRSPGAETVANNYIVKFKIEAGHDAIKASQAKALDLLRQRGPVSTAGGGSSEARFYNISSFVAMHVVADEDTIHQIGSDPAVEYVETDSVAELATTVTQKKAPNGLSRISHANIEKGDSLTYSYDSSAGEGITAYIVDTGINISHPDFGGRARFGRNIFSDNDDASDENGHGTMVASILAGTRFGVAKKTNLVAVTVTNLGGITSWSLVMAGLQWCYDDAKKHNRVSKSLINISIGGRTDSSFNGTGLIQLAQALVGEGMLIVASAGNAHADTAYYAPASAPAVLTVGALAQRNDSKAWFSNYGSPVDIFAPGMDVHGAWIVDSENLDPSYPDHVESGTSQAAPHVAGLCAYLMRLEGLSTPAAVISRLLQLAKATGATVKQNEPNTTNLIANNGFR